MPHAAKNTMAYATSEKCVSVDTRQNAETKYATQKELGQNQCLYSW